MKSIKRRPIVLPQNVKKPTNKPAWNDNITDMKRYQLTNVEQLQRKVSCSSKNLLNAKEAVNRVQQKLKEGKLPSEYRDAISHKFKKENKKAEYKQKVKEIVYPIQPRPTSSCANRKAAQVKQEPSQEIEKENEPVELISKVANLVFTSANDQKIEQSALNNNQQDPENESKNEEESNYLDCNVNLKKLSKLQEEMAHKPPEIDEYFSKHQTVEYDLPDKDIYQASTYTEPGLYSYLTHEEAPKEEKEINVCAMDETELERVSRLIAETQKEIDAAYQPVPIPEPIPEKVTLPTVTIDADQIKAAYGNSHFHAASGKKANKENIDDGLNAAKIVSRRISNKMDLSLSSAIAPRPLIIPLEQSNTNI